MASKGGFEGDVGEVERRMGQIASRTRDIAQNLERAAERMADFGRMADDSARKVDQIKDRMRRANDAGNRMEFDKLGKDFDRFARRAMAFRGLDKLATGFERVAKGIIKMNAGALTGFFAWLGDSIKRVYELQERWTRAIGGFNMRIGGLTAGLRGAQKAATAWSSTIRGLTNGDIFEGIQMFEEFTMTLGRVISKGDEFQRFGLQLARGFNLGGSEAGKMTRVFANMGLSAGDAAKTMSELAEGANMVGTPVNLLAKDVAEANDYMVRFGKQGARVFVTAAAYARRFSMSMADLQRATEKFDLFDNAAKTAATINTVFGTMVNSVDLMLQDDPAARIETVRKSLLAQGYTYERLAPKQVRLLSEELGVTNEQVAALLSLNNATFSYQELQAKQLAKEKTEVQAKRNMELALRKTAQTMYAFGAAFDRITVAIANAIRPVLEVLGLARRGGKDFKSFGEVMESVTRHIVSFFNSLAKNEKWQAFMRELARDMVRAGRALSDFISSGKAVEWAGKVSNVMRETYQFARDAFGVMLSVGQRLAPLFLKLAEHSREIVLVYAAGKAASTAIGVGLKARELVRGSRRPAWDDRMIDPTAARALSGGGSVGGGRTGGIDWATATGDPFAKERTQSLVATPEKRPSRFRGVMRGGLAGAGMGALGAIGPLLAGGNIADALGAGIGGALGGALGGPIGAAIGTFAGEAIVSIGRRIFRKPPTAHEREMTRLNEELESLQKRRLDQQGRHNAALELLERRREANEARRAAFDGRLDELKRRAGRKSIELTADEARALLKQSEGLKAFAGSNEAARSALMKLAQPESGPVSLTSRELVGLQQVSALYQKELEKLRGATAIEADGRLAQLQVEANAKAKELKTKTLEQELKDSSGQVARAKIMSQTTRGGNISLEAVRLFEQETGRKFKTIFEAQNNVRLKAESKAAKEFLLKRERQEEQLKRMQVELVRDQLANERKIFALQYRSALLGSEEFLAFLRDAEGRGIKRDAAQSLFFTRQLQTGNIGADLYRELIAMKPVALAAGGVVTRPTMAMIGEGGPEAVVPLRAAARPLGVGGTSAQVARNLVNYAAGSPVASSGGQRTVFVAGDVVLDGAKVGRVLVREAMTRVEG
jgi:hypothetical protein